MNVLISNPRISQKLVVQLSGLSERSVRDAISTLLEEKIILQRASLFDAREKIYEVIK
ncbi:winged helix-turn-helix transcriptional regulator [Candidatus Woesearchaeota archaeon]|nr:winged helix-turn-helix transcriptional regulator [Candidatus Woesearchaeota archaeon]MBT7402722.1 winged helix-turn-helix transcriptional regulator [Candidatus Woesearchaeota archaeon]